MDSDQGDEPCLTLVPESFAQKHNMQYIICVLFTPSFNYMGTHDWYILLCGSALSLYFT